MITSYYKNPAVSEQFLNAWKSKLEKLNGCSYKRKDIQTSLGNTIIWTINEDKPELETFVCFPGARTSILYWDFDNALSEIKKRFRLYLVETNGQPNQSDLNSPEIQSDAYGHWAVEVLDKLAIKQTHVGGASFGGLVCMRLAMVAPDRVKKAFLLNPGGIQAFSISFKNLYYNILPIVAPSRKNIRKFLDAAVFCKPNHYPTEEAMELLIDHAEHALTQMKDNTQKPAKIPDKDLRRIKSPVYLFCGDRDLLFLGKKSIESARKNIPGLVKAELMKDVAHGIETHKAVYDLILKEV